MLTSKILDTVTTLYHDKDYDRLDEADYFNLITDALNLILLVRPDANSIGAIYTTVDGLEQPLPDDGFRLIDVVYMVDPVDESPVSSITKVDRMIMDNSHPLWMQDTDTVCTDYLYDPTVPKEFILYPRVAAGTKVKLYYSKAFDRITSASQVIPLDDIFFNPVVDAVMLFLYRTDMESSEFSATKADFHSKSFYTSLQSELTSGAAISPAGGK